MPPKPPPMTAIRTPCDLSSDTSPGLQSNSWPSSVTKCIRALSDRATALKALTRGAHGFLLKPFSDEQLVESLRELME